MEEADGLIIGGGSEGMREAELDGTCV